MASTASNRLRVVVVGAGCIGCFMGGALATGGDCEVILIGRERLQRAVSENDGLELSDFKGNNVRAHVRVETAITAELLTKERNIDAVIVLIACKSKDVATCSEQLASVLANGDASVDAVVVLQNGLDSAAAARAALSHHELQHVPVCEGSFGANVRWQAANGFRLATGNPVMVDSAKGVAHLQQHPALASHMSRLAALVNASPLALSAVTHDDIAGVKHAKLLLNLNNSINALSGLPLVEELTNRACRCVLACAIEEALAAYRENHIKPRRIGPLVPALLPVMLRVPTWFYRIVAPLHIDPQARSSMYDDLVSGRPTEAEHLNGAVIALCEQKDIACPVNRALLSLVRDAERQNAAAADKAVDTSAPSPPIFTAPCIPPHKLHELVVGSPPPSTLPFYLILAGVLASVCSAVYCFFS
eukprot:TRINITY_DN9047_c0_g1_i1.p1 TRINITY_DN9047_c0_g1~~TRINITY_DN9047_c0_g1_i1.p1  ORF type:complete len:418 (-),score=87.85 TRINITY_DN9047_c0_g1_i1:77-1330(-)